VTALQDYLWTAAPPHSDRSMKPACATCDRIHSADNVQAIGRFKPGGPDGHRAMRPGAPLRATRAEAKCDWCPGWVD